MLFCSENMVTIVKGAHPQIKTSNQFLSIDINQQNQSNTALLLKINVFKIKKKQLTPVKYSKRMKTAII